MLDLTKPLPRPIRKEFFENVLNAESLDDQKNKDIRDYSLDELEKMLEDTEDMSGFMGLHDIRSELLDSGQIDIDDSKWWVDKDAKGNEITPKFEEGDTIRKVLVAPYYLVYYVIKSLKRRKKSDILPFLDTSFMLFGAIGVLSAIMIILDIKFIVNFQELAIASVIMSLASKVSKSLLEVRIKGNPEITEVEESYVETENTVEDFEEYGDYEDIEFYNEDIDYGDEDDYDDPGVVQARLKREYSKELPITENIVTTKDREEYKDYLLKAFENSKRYRDRDLYTREDIVLSMNEYILCNNPGFSELSSIPKNSTVYNNISYLIYEGLRGIYSQLTFTGEYVIKVHSLTENQMYYKFEVELPKIVKLDRVIRDLSVIESKFKAHETDNDVDITVSSYGNIFVFRIKKVNNIVVTWGDAIRYYDPVTGIQTFKDFIDEEKYGLPIMVGLQNDETPIIFDVDENTNIAIAGTSGSGKSWAVFLLIYNIIIQSHPGDASFIIFDFKGDVQYEALARLPHVVGLFNHKDRPEMYIEYLREVLAEMNRRAELLRELGVSKWSELRKSFRNNPEQRQKFPWLFVIMEETAAVLSSLESQSKDLKDEYIRVTKEIAKQCRSLGIRIVMISQRTTSGDLPRDIESECGVKFTFKLKESDLERVEMLPTGVIPPKKKGTAVFKEEFLTEPIVIKSLGIGGLNDFQIQNLTRMIAFEWHLRINDDIINNFPIFNVVNNWRVRRQQVLEDLKNGNYFNDVTKINLSEVINKLGGNAGAPIGGTSTSGNSTSTRTQVPKVKIYTPEHYEVEEIRQEVIEDEYFDIDDLYKDEYEEDIEVEPEELIEDETEEFVEDKNNKGKPNSRPMRLGGMMGAGARKGSTKPKNDYTKVEEMVKENVKEVAKVEEPVSERTKVEERPKRKIDIVEFIIKYGEGEFGERKVPHEIIRKYYTEEEIEDALASIAIVDDHEGHYLA